LRRVRPDLARPYRVVGYPIVPTIFVTSVVWFVVNALVNDPGPTMITFALIFAGAPVYFLFFSPTRASFR
jgi:APA family basic amino acid/polyamine antiporter